MVIAEAMKLGSHHVTFEDEEMVEQTEERAESEIQFPDEAVNFSWEVADTLPEDFPAYDQMPEGGMSEEGEKTDEPLRCLCRRQSQAMRWRCMIWRRCIKTDRARIQI